VAASPAGPAGVVKLRIASLRLALGGPGNNPLTRIRQVPAVDPVMAPQRTEAPGHRTANVALIVLSSCAAKPAAVWGIGPFCANTLMVRGSGGGTVVGWDTDSTKEKSFVAVVVQCVTVVLAAVVPV